MRILEKVERRLGEKLLLKGDRCAGPKCAVVRRQTPPGMHGKKRRRNPSEYGELLREKQKVRFLYGIDDRDVRRYSDEAENRAGLFQTNFLRLLESRLDNVVFRLGFATSRHMARHLVSYGHILVNGRRTTIPSYRTRAGDTISIRAASQNSALWEGLDARLKKVVAPPWLRLDAEKRSGEVIETPALETVEVPVEVTKVKEFYSR